jgi:hypothetical protein
MVNNFCDDIKNLDAFSIDNGRKDDKLLENNN